MDVMEFAQKLGEDEKDPVVGQWAENFKDFVVRQTIYLGRHTNRLPAQLRESYWDILQSALDSMPKGSYIQVTFDLDDRINSAAPDGIKPLIKSHIRSLQMTN